MVARQERDWFPGGLRHQEFFGGREITIHSALPGAKLDVGPCLKEPDDFHGNHQVDHVVRFGQAFEVLIGKFDPQLHGAWNPDTLPEQGIVVLEYYYDEARQLADAINALASRVVADNRLYDDVACCTQYFELAQAGYALLRKYQHQRGFETFGIPVSLERAGLVTTRLVAGLGKDAAIPAEVRVVTKRTHLIDEPETALTVTVDWRDRSQLKASVHGAEVELADFVNPASGASGAAFLLAAKLEGAVPAMVTHRSVSLTCQGALFMRRELGKLGIQSRFYSVAAADELNGHYYLVGNRTVADAGHLLRHFLPEDYQA